MPGQYFVYIVGNNRPTLYIGVTNSLAKRIDTHRQGLVEGFTKDHQLDKLFYYETFPTIAEAIHREKCLKRWKREWKIRLIQQVNPTLEDIGNRVSL